MQYCVLPGTELSVSRIALGTDVYGTQVAEEDAYLLLDQYKDMGGTVIDTAHIYADWLSEEKHLSEKTIGKWLRRSGKRSELVIATKGGHPPLGQMHVSRLSRTELEQDVQESLYCLGVDTIDLYWLHRDDPRVPVGEILETLQDIARTGKIRYYGASNWSATRLAEAEAYAKQHGMRGFVASQIKWSLARSNPGAVGDETLVEMDAKQHEWYRASSLPVFAFASQAKGFFSKLREKEGEIAWPPGKAGCRYGNERNLAVWRSLQALEQQSGESIAALVLAWLLQQDILTIPIVGCKTKQQLQESLAAVNVPILQELQNIYS